MQLQPEWLATTSRAESALLGAALDLIQSSGSHSWTDGMLYMRSALKLKFDGSWDTVASQVHGCRRPLLRQQRLLQSCASPAGSSSLLSSKVTTYKETGIGAAHQHRPNKESHCSQQDLQ